MNTYFFSIPPIVSKAFEVIGGGYGTGDERKKKLEAEGYDYSKIQSCVNDVMKIFQKYGE